MNEIGLTFRASEDLLSPKGDQWDVVIIGVNADGSNLTNVRGVEYIVSENRRLYSIPGIIRDVDMWANPRVYDNHMTEDEYKSKKGARSPLKEWLGTITDVRWDNDLRALRGVFKVAEEALSKKLLKAHELGILDSIGLSVDSFIKKVGTYRINETVYDVLDGFHQILSVDVVGRPAAGGRFLRVLASIDEEKEEKTMPELTTDQVRSIVEEQVDSKIEAAVLRAFENILEDPRFEGQGSAPSEEVVNEPNPEVQRQLEEIETLRQNTLRDLEEMRTATFNTALVARLSESTLTKEHQALVRRMVGDQVLKMDQVDAIIQEVMEAQAAMDTSGNVRNNGGNPISVLDEADAREIAFMQKIMGRDFLKLEGHSSDLVTERLTESFNVWKNQGKPMYDFNGRTSELLRTQFLGGQWSIEDVSYQEAVVLATVIKNTVNIMTALDYAGTNKWYENIVDVMESDNPIDDFTLARLFDAGELSVVTKGAAYTEMVMQDEEETATHVKRGNFIGVHIEDLMADKIAYFRNLPERLSGAWYNTLSARVAAVFTLNSAVGPTLSDTGALFNATAVTTAAGHANLLTTALSWTAFDTVMTAMYNQTSRTLGTGRKLTEIHDIHLLVPTALRATANKIRNSELQPEADGSSTTGNQSTNEYYQGFKVLQVPDWTDATDWAVLARHKGKSPIKLIFPRGMRTPVILTADSELGGTMFTNDTIRFKLKMMTYRQSATDDCAPVSDWRLLHKSNVAG